MKRLTYILLFVVAAVSCTTKVPICVETPKRPAGQEDAVQMTAPAIDTVRVGFIGLGMRGTSAVSRYLHIPGILQHTHLSLQYMPEETASKVPPLPLTLR